MKNIYLLWIVFVIIKSTNCLCFSSSTAIPRKMDMLTNHPNRPTDIEEQCGLSFADRIIGGVNASLGQYPWLARIGYNSK